MKYNDFQISKIDVRPRDPIQQEDWEIEVKKIFPSKNQAKKYLHEMLKKNNKIFPNSTTARIMKEEDKQRKTKIIIRENSDNEFALSYLRDVIFGEFEIIVQDGKITALCHGTITVDEEFVTTSLEAFEK